MTDNPEYHITYQDTQPRPAGTSTPTFNDYIRLSSVSQRVYALITSGYVITRIEATA